MKTARWAVAAAFLGAMVLHGVSCAAPEPPKASASEGHKGVVIGKEADGKKVEVPAGTKFVVRLPGNATTGYMWELAKVEGAVVEQVGKEEYIPDPPPGGKAVTGSGGVSVFTFKAVKGGTSALSFVYRRSWEKDQPPAQKFGVTVEVK
jgi:inhibitor of cysteine peptidase